MIIKLPKKKSRFVKTPYIDPKSSYAKPERVQRFKEKAYKLTEFAHPKGVIENKLEKRRIALEKKAKKALEPPPEPPKHRG